MTPRRRDRNHAEIRDALRKCGVFVVDLADCGHGIPDLLAVKNRRVKLLEVKMPGEHLTPDEERFHSEYPGDIEIVYSAEEAIERMS
jgi:hypothetical protein